LLFLLMLPEVMAENLTSKRHINTPQTMNISQNKTIDCRQKSLCNEHDSTSAVRIYRQYVRKDCEMIIVFKSSY
jgi:hypothetical protein